METKHTAGEWKATGLEIRHKNRVVIIATVYPHLELNVPKEEALVNAKLIAAAPELLDALIEFVNIERGHLSDVKTTPKERLQNAINVIKKAT